MAHSPSGPNPPSYPWPALPWTTCPRCGGNPRPQWAGTDREDGVVVQYYEVTCLQCTHLLADYNDGAPALGWVERWNRAPSIPTLDLVPSDNRRGARVPGSGVAA